MAKTNQNINWEEKEKKNRRIGWAAAIGFHALLLILFLFLALTAPHPPPAEEGILVNFGTADVGSGEVQPEQVNESMEESRPEASDAPAAQEETMTQDVEDAPSLPEQKENKPVKDPEKKETKTEPQEEQPKEPEIDPDLLYKGKKNNTSKGEGTDNEAGDKGSKEGIPEDGAYEGKSYGTGKAGVNHSFSGRLMIVIPNINDQSQKTGKVVVRVKVDKDGNITFAEYQQKGSTTTDLHLRNLALKAAKEAQFSSDPSAPDVQWGTISFTFKVR